MAARKLFCQQQRSVRTFSSCAIIAKSCSRVRKKLLPFLCQGRRDQTSALMKEMFSNVPDNAASGVFSNENSRGATVTEAGRIVFSLIRVS